MHQNIDLFRQPIQQKDQNSTKLGLFGYLNLSWSKYHLSNFIVSHLIHVLQDNLGKPELSSYCGCMDFLLKWHESTSGQVPFMTPPMIVMGFEPRIYCLQVMHPNNRTTTAPCCIAFNKYELIKDGLKVLNVILFIVKILI